MVPCSASRRGFLRLSRVLPTSRVFTSGYVNTETILHFFNEALSHRRICLNKLTSKFLLSYCSYSEIYLINSLHVPEMVKDYHV